MHGIFLFRIFILTDRQTDVQTHYCTRKRKENTKKIDMNKEKKVLYIDETEREREREREKEKENIGIKHSI
jgi:hypothetical protein